MFQGGDTASEMPSALTTQNNNNDGSNALALWCGTSSVETLSAIITLLCCRGWMGPLL